MATFYAALAYNANQGSGAPGTQTGSSSTAGYKYQFTISSSKPSRTYYTFQGWALSSGASSASYASGGSITVPCATIDGQTNTTTLYAVWKRNTAYVYYNANGGTGAPSTQTHNAGTSVNLSATKPTRSGYLFLGWATTSTATVKQYDAGQSNVPLYNTTTLYAVWQQAYSALSASSGTMGTAMTIGITRYVNTYTDTITYTFGTATGTIVTKTGNASVSWTPPTTLASEIPNSASGSLVLTCTTYNGNTVVGTSSITVSLAVPQSLAPSASVSFADTDATCLGWGVYVQSRSKLSFTITASGQQGATIASYSTAVNGTTYNSATFTTDVILYNGSNSYTTVVTDSRGLQTTVTGTFNVVAYSVPSLTLTLCDRDDSDDSQINIEFDFAVASVSNNNDANYRLDYKLKSSSTWTNGTVQNLGAYSGSISDLIANLDGGDEWDIRINVIDSFQTSSVESEVGVSGNILLNSRHAGGLGLLMKSQAQNQLDIGKPTVHHGGSVVSSNNVSGNYAKILTFGTESTAVSLDVDCPITLEFVMAGYSSPATLTINFNRDYTLASFTKDASADAYLYNSATNVWDLYIGRATSTDSVEILDFHNPLGNRDITLTWGNTSISTLPTGYVEATPANTVLSEAPSSISLSSGSWKTTASITFARGIWLLSAFVQFASNTSGRRSAVLSASQDDSTSIRNMSSDNQAPVNGAITLCRFVDVLQIPTQTTYYLNAYQNSGSSLTTYGRMVAIKLV